MKWLHLLMEYMLIVYALMAFGYDGVGNVGDNPTFKNSTIDVKYTCLTLTKIYMEKK